jgi:hypothetical protein
MEIAEDETAAAGAKDPGTPKVAVGLAMGRLKSSGAIQHFSGICKVRNH